MRLVAIALLVLELVACAPPLAPLAPRKDPPGTCETARDRFAELHCDVDLAAFVDECHATERAEADIRVRLPVGCVTNAPDCKTAFACNGTQ